MAVAKHGVSMSDDVRPWRKRWSLAVYACDHQDWTFSAVLQEAAGPPGSLGASLPLVAAMLTSLRVSSDRLRGLSQEDARSKSENDGMN